MAEKFSENQFCRACGANIRQGALFCYNCGTTVAQDVALETANEKQNEASNFGFAEKFRKE
jgi:predicted amidophosphoribosyltransferase